MFRKFISHDISVYGGYILDKQKLLNSSSGGIATALSELIVEQGGYVVGVSYTKDFHGAEYIIVDDLKELVKLKGSKYIEVNNNNIFTKVKKMINDDKKVLFFGLPCVVAALYSFLGERPHNLITCELICNGPTYSKVHSDYIGYLEKKIQKNWKKVSKSSKS